MKMFVLLFMSTLTSWAARPYTPYYDLVLKILPDLKSVHLKGELQGCSAQGGPKMLYVPSSPVFRMSLNGKEFASHLGEIHLDDWNCYEEGDQRFLFEGQGRLAHPRCETREDEVYCLNNSLIHPVVDSGRQRFEARFEVPEGFSVLKPSDGSLHHHGYSFQVARLQEEEKVSLPGNLDVEFFWPQGFTPKKHLLDYLLASLGFAHKIGLGLPFQTIRVGAIRRGQEKGEISGSPAGNLLLFSRTALGDPASVGSLQALGISTDAMRKLVLGHEPLHFFFAAEFRGRDGWMTEGISNYISTVFLMQKSPSEGEEILKLLEYVNSQLGPQSPMNLPYGGGRNYLLAYYRAPLLLYRIGEVLGHETLIQFLMNSFRKNPDPDFASLHQDFQAQFPQHRNLLRTVFETGSVPQTDENPTPSTAASPPQTAP